MSSSLGDAPTIRVLDSLSGIDPVAWNRLAQDQPFLRHEFFHALHETGCACEGTGWQPQFVTLWQGGKLAGALPLYLKSHSYGEYVFDWAWAEAYQRHGLAYYPKLLSAVPFSPVTGPRLLAPDAAMRRTLIEAALELARDVSSLHCLLPSETEAREWETAGLMLRQGVQFHWQNAGYRSFEDFLGVLSHDKRKKIRQERRRVRESGVTFRRLGGAAIRHEDWQFFTRCYNHTYRAHHSTPYLNLAFFERLGQTMPDNLLLIVAEQEGRPVASTLNVHTGDVLYGRYWGEMEHIPLLHFEACYYQALEFCIERGIRIFEGGAQGAHKLARGFLPIKIWSAHWLQHPRFANAVEEFLARETKGVGRHIDELREHSPFRRPD
jgi:uncharacterized protein